MLKTTLSTYSHSSMCAKWVWTENPIEFGWTGWYTLTLKL